MEVLAPVTFTKEKIYEIVKKTNGCIVWGGSFKIAPADDILIKVEAPLLFESYDKILVSIMAKKIAFGSNHVVIDLPYGKTVKVHRLSDAKVLAQKFEDLAKRFDVKIKVLVHKTDEPAGKGIGPVLETREALKVLEQRKDRPLDLEVRALNLAGTLLDLCLLDSPQHLQDEVKKQYGNGIGWATHLLQNGQAFEKMQTIIKAQGGKEGIKSIDLHPGKHIYEIKSERHGVITDIYSKNLTVIAKILGAPKQKGAGLYLHKKIGEKVEKGEILYTIYSETEYNLKEAKDSLSNLTLMEVA
jgi:AMP phosphorylase